MRYGFLAAAVAAALASCGDKSENADGDRPPFSPFHGEWKSEEHWMTGATLDLLGHFTGKSPELTASLIRNRKPQLEVDGTLLELKPSCWDTATFTPLITGWELTPSSSPSDGPDYLSDLLDCSVSGIQKANKTISERLAAAPLAPEVHEEAAFLLGVFCMLENARDFSDQRLMISRITGHLALADALRVDGGPTEIGEWARVLHDLHAGRPKLALARADERKPKGASRRWQRTVRLLATGDWRPVHDVKELSLAESIAKARALQHHYSRDAMLEFAGESEELEKSAEWTRLIAANGGRSVGNGHIAREAALGMELVEISQIFPLSDVTEPEDFQKALGRNPEGTEGLLISPGDWRNYFRRHFFAACTDVVQFCREQWGTDEGAYEWVATAEPYCKAFTRYSLVAPYLATTAKGYQKAADKIPPYVLKHPERVPLALWCDYKYPPEGFHHSITGGLPSQTYWFHEASPPGTAHDPRKRVLYEGLGGQNWKEGVVQLHQIDPWNSLLCYEVAENTGFTMERVNEAWGDMVSYSVRPIRQVLRIPSLSLEERIEFGWKLAELDPNHFVDLGGELAIAGKPEDAIKAFERAYHDATNSVSFSHDAQWMIHYYESRGDAEKADEVANHVAEIYSSRGLDAAQALAISRNNAELARELGRANDERYGNGNNELIGAAMTGNEEALEIIFPGGMKKVSKEDFSPGTRYGGQRISSKNNLEMKANGIRRGDVVVALDGVRVETLIQYRAVMQSDIDPNIDVIIQRKGETLELECLLPQRRFRCDLDTFTP